MKRSGKKRRRSLREIARDSAHGPLGRAGERLISKRENRQRDQRQRTDPAQTMPQGRQELANAAIFMCRAVVVIAVARLMEGGRRRFRGVDGRVLGGQKLDRQEKQQTNASRRDFEHAHHLRMKAKKSRMAIQNGQIANSRMQWRFALYNIPLGPGSKKRPSRLREYPRVRR